MNYYTHYDHSPESQAKALADLKKMTTPWRPKMPKVPNPVVAYYGAGLKVGLWWLNRRHPEEAQELRDWIRHRSSLGSVAPSPPKGSLPWSSG